MSPKRANLFVQQKLVLHSLCTANCKLVTTSILNYLYHISAQIAIHSSRVFIPHWPPIHLHLIFELSSSRNWFLNLIFDLDFLSISNLIFTASVKVRQSQNDFFKPTFLPKNERMNSTKLLWYHRLTCFHFFLEEIEDTKKTFRN